MRRSSVEATSPKPHPSTDGRSPEPCACGRPTWSTVVDLCLELQTARERLTAIDADLVDLVAIERHDFYTKTGGTKLTLAAFRAKVRHEILTGEHI